MKAGLATSVVLHAVVLGFGLLTLSAPPPMEVVNTESFPVEIVPISDLSQIQQGDKTAPLKEMAAPKPTARPDVVADARNAGENSIDTPEPPTPEPTPKPVKTTDVPPPQPKPVDKPIPMPDTPERKPEPTPATEVAPVPAPKEDVKPEPVKQAEAKPEPVKKPEPAPNPEPVKEARPVVQPKPQPLEDAVADAIEAAPTPPKEELAEKPQPEVKPETTASTRPDTVESSTDTVQLPSSAPSPQAKPAPPLSQTAKTTDRKASDKPVQEAAVNPQSNEHEFNAADIEALLNKQKPSGGGAKRSTKEASLGGKQTTGGSKLSQTEMDGLRGQVQKCWNIPAGAVDGDKLRVSVKFKLTPEGEIDGSPEIISGAASSGVERAAAEAARRAVSRCAPYNLPAEKYAGGWDEVIVNFDPSEMF